MTLYINFVHSHWTTCHAKEFKYSKVKMAINDNGIITLKNCHKLASLVLWDGMQTILCKCSMWGYTSHLWQSSSFNSIKCVVVVFARLISFIIKRISTYIILLLYYFVMCYMNERHCHDWANINIFRDICKMKMK